MVVVGRGSLFYIFQVLLSLKSQGCHYLLNHRQRHLFRLQIHLFLYKQLLPSSSFKD